MIDVKGDLAFEQRKTQFHEEYKKLSSKYKLDLAAIITYTKNGIFPVIALVDLTEKEKKDGQ